MFRVELQEHKDARYSIKIHTQDESADIFVQNVCLQDNEATLTYSQILELRDWINSITPNLSECPVCNDPAFIVGFTNNCGEFEINCGICNFNMKHPCKQTLIKIWNDKLTRETE